MEMSMDFGSPIVSLSPFKTVSLSRKNREGCRIFFPLATLEKKDGVQCLDCLDDNGMILLQKLQFHHNQDTSQKQNFEDKKFLTNCSDIHFT